MKIMVARYSRVGDIEIPPGEYLVSLNSDLHIMVLVGRGLEFCCPPPDAAPARRPGSPMSRFTAGVGGAGAW